MQVEELGTGAGDAPRYFRATGVESAYEDIETAYASLQELQVEHGGLEHMCRIFECEDAIEPATSNLKAIVKGLVDIKGMWDAVMMIDSQVVAFGEILWAECDISSLEHEAGTKHIVVIQLDCLLLAAMPFAHIDVQMHGRSFFFPPVNDFADVLFPLVTQVVSAPSSICCPRG